MESPDAQETQAETGAPETAAPETPALETAAPETPALETAAPETEAPETEAPQEAAPEEVLPEEPQTPPKTARPKGRPKGSKTVNRKAKAPEAPTAPPEARHSPLPSVETPPDIFELIRQRQTAQYERRQAFYQTFLPML